ncbi:uncharacterized protein LOC122847866 [Aphidius gifuensis]|uniref:uncharacterized protein LOC122847866 n=1 Tax=Aphidius gifuensis TaxID=684658 RepID=UPI001CDD45A3|nr:uncharacterized protein LOC122847866 [Aphidius gifuensis]
MAKRRAENNIKKTKRKIKKMSIDKLENQIIVDESIGSMTLNQDCLSKIFRYLSIENKLNVEKVCLAWKKAAKWSWSNIKIFTLDKNKFSINNEQLIESLYLKKILTRCKIYLQHLKIRDILDENLINYFTIWNA